MAPLREGGIVAESATVNKVCRVMSLSAFSAGLSSSLPLPVSLLFRGLKRWRREFSESKVSKLESQHEFSLTEIIVQMVLHHLFSLNLGRGTDLVNCRNGLFQKYP